jgi:hypothetical protein
MFPVAIVLIALGYTTLYYGASMAKAYKNVHRHNLAPDSKGGIPYGVLLGVIVKPTLPTDAERLGQGQSFPPFVTGTENHRPKGEK